MVTLTLLASCGGSGKYPRTEKASKARASEPEEDQEAEPDSPPKKKQRKQLYAKAALTPVKGTKLKPLIVSFSQRGDEETSIESDDMNGAKPGTYWLIVHKGDKCGPNATKAGAPWPGASQEKLRIVVGKDLTGGLEASVVRFDLTGDDGAVGHVLLLHENKKGKPGKALACGVIEEVDEL